MGDTDGMSSDTCTGCDVRGQAAESFRYCEECRLHQCKTCWETHRRVGCLNRMGVRVFICDICLEKGQCKRGIHYCEFCKINLCSVCLDKHLGVFPGQTIRRRQGCKKPTLNPLEICDKHPDVAVEYYCKCNDSVFCAECKQRLHPQCQTVTYISEACNEAPVREPFQQLATTTRDLLALCNDKLKEEDQLIAEKISCLDTVEELPVLHERYITLLDDILENMPNKITDFYEDEQCRILSDLAVLDVYSRNLETFKTDLLQVKTSKSHQRVKFLAMKSLDLQMVRECVEQIRTFTSPIKLRSDVLNTAEELLRKLRQKNLDSYVTVKWQS